MENEINVLFINFYLSKRIAKFKMRIIFISKIKFFRNAYNKVIQTLNVLL